MPEESQERPAGYYWVKFPAIDRLVVAEWFPATRHWLIPGKSGCAYDMGIQGIVCYERVRRVPALAEQPAGFLAKLIHFVKSVGWQTSRA